jgi:sugar phosphate isomerase/epimerase
MTGAKGARVPSVDDPTNRVMRLHHRGITPGEIAHRQNMLFDEVKEILAKHGVTVTAHHGVAGSMWNGDDPDELRRRIIERARMGARKQLQELGK